MAYSVIVTKPKTFHDIGREKEEERKSLNIYKYIVHYN